MPIEVTWDNDDKTVIRFDVSGAWSMEDINASRREMFAMCDTVTHQVDLMWHWVDVKTNSRIPPGIIMLFAAMQRSPHPRRGMIVSVPKRQDPTAKIWRDVIAKAFPHLRAKMIGATTLDEAREMLQSMRNHIPR